jgi:hypothetical protein
MKRLWILALLSGCAQQHSETPKGSTAIPWESDFLRLTFFRFDRVPDPDNPQAYTNQPIAFALYSRSFKELRGESKTETYFTAFPHIGGRPRLVEPRRLLVYTGVLPDSEFREELKKIIDLGLLELPRAAEEPPASLFAKMRTSDDAPRIQMIHLESEKESILLRFWDLPRDLNDPTTKSFRTVAAAVDRLMLMNTRRIEVGVSDDK